jgi:hypothetical protein
MIEPFNAVGHILTVWGLSKRDDIMRNIEALRHHRSNSKWTNWMKDLRIEMIQTIYEQPFYPKNLYADRAPMTDTEYDETVIKKQIALMQDRGIWKAPETPD